MKKNKISLVCSGGGHLNQIKELIPALHAKHSISLVTLDRADASLALKEDINEYTLRDIRGNGSKLLNLLDSIWLFYRINPNVIITTGAGAAYFICLLGWVFNRKVIFVESFARITGPSEFGKKISKIANPVIYQWPGLKSFYKNGIFGGPIFNYAFQSEHKASKQVFITVGSSEFGFERLLEMVEKLYLQNEQLQVFFAQTGRSNVDVISFDHTAWLSKEEIDDWYKNASIVITHAGSGSIINALAAGAKVIAVPRKAELDEHIDNHQFDIAHQFKAMGLIKVANDFNSLLVEFNAMDGFSYKDNFSNREMLKVIEEHL